MVVRFSKWEGTGNDFILIDDREKDFPADDVVLITRLCDRHFGIGSDGLILIQAPADGNADYHMEFFNPDASRSFCGNGSRCTFAFWRALTAGPERAGFTAIDGLHEAAVDTAGVRVSLAPPKGVERIDDRTDFIHTGSPHLLAWVDDPETVNIVPQAHAYRYNDRFSKEGVNVNFVRWHDGRVEMRTYERGVEAETLSCGTGVTAAAIAAVHRGVTPGGVVPVHTRGGDLSVQVGMNGSGGFSSVELIGPAREVFTGTFII